jgi:hypothetical protein
MNARGPGPVPYPHTAGVAPPPGGQQCAGAPGRPATDSGPPRGNAALPQYDRARQGLQGSATNNFKNGTAPCTARDSPSSIGRDSSKKELFFRTVHTLPALVLRLPQCRKLQPFLRSTPSASVHHRRGLRTYWQACRPSCSAAQLPGRRRPLLHLGADPPACQFEVRAALARCSAVWVSNGHRT